MGRGSRRPEAEAAGATLKRFGCSEDQYLVILPKGLHRQLARIHGKADKIQSSSELHALGDTRIVSRRQCRAR